MRSKILLLAAVAIVACRPTTSVEPESEFTLAVGESARIAGTDITLVLERVANESRCPTDAVCVWEGNAAVQVRVRPTTNTESVLTLNTNIEPRSAVIDAYTLALSDLAPHPRSTMSIPQQDYRARFRLSR